MYAHLLIETQKRVSLEKKNVAKSLSEKYYQSKNIINFLSNSNIQGTKNLGRKEYFIYFLIPFYQRHRVSYSSTIYK